MASFLDALKECLKMKRYGYSNAENERFCFSMADFSTEEF